MTMQEIAVCCLVVALLFALMIYTMGFKNWLVWAVSEAEATLGSGTGKLKLRYAFNLAVKHYPILAKLIPFELFSAMVDNALKVMREMIEDNAAIKAVLTEDEGTEADV